MSEAQTVEEKSDTPGEAGGLMSVTAPRADVLAKGSRSNPRIDLLYQQYLAPEYNVSLLLVQNLLSILHILVPRNALR
jgi:hypothetical protein